MLKFSALLLSACLAAACPVMAQKAAAPAQAGASSKDIVNRIDQLTGKMWKQSTTDAKLGFLLGIEVALSSDYLSTNPPAGSQLDLTRLSPFGKAWYLTFKDTAPVAIMQKLDKWFAAHPDKLDSHVMTILWTEIMHQPLPGTHKK